MRIGIIDYDLYERPKLKRLNPEVMKIGKYYEDRGFQVEVLSPADNILNYDKIIFICNYLNFIYRKFLYHPDVEFYGLYFNNIDYKPFFIKDIDYNETDNKIYNNYLKYLFVNKIYNKKDIEKIRENSYVRIFPNEEPINIDSLLRGQKIYVSDNNFYNHNNWKQIATKMSVYKRYFSFVYPQIIKNTQDFLSFIELLQYEIVNTRGMIEIEDLENFNSFIKENKENLIKYSSKLEWRIGYNKNNNYSEKFFLKELENTFKKIEFLHREEIPVKKGKFFSYTKFSLTDQVYEALVEWIRNNQNEKKSFAEIFFTRNDNKKMRDVLVQYVSFISKHPEIEQYTNKIYKKEEK